MHFFWLSAGYVQTRSDWGFSTSGENSDPDIVLVTAGHSATDGTDYTGIQTVLLRKQHFLALNLPSAEATTILQLPTVSLKLSLPAFGLSGHISVGKKAQRMWTDISVPSITVENRHIPILLNHLALETFPGLLSWSSTMRIH